MDLHTPPLQQSATALEVLMHAFDAHTCRQQLWNATKAYLCSEDADGLTAQERSRCIFFYETISAVVESIFDAAQHSPAPVVLFSPPPAA